MSLKLKKSDLYRFYNEDCIEGCRKHISSNSIDLIITDPPYGISGDKMHQHYNRKEDFVINGYVEIPKAEYPEFSRRWIKEAERILKPGGSIYIVSGYTNLADILNALKETRLKEKNHIIWKYNFGVYTKTKYISSHYHILFYVKPGKKHYFNTTSRYGLLEKSDKDRSLNYKDREDVWIINREYKPGKIKNKNELPRDLLIKIMQYSAREGDIICDLFLGSFSTARVAIGLNMRVIGFEISKEAFEYQMEGIRKLRPGYLLPSLKKPVNNDIIKNQGKRWTIEEKQNLLKRYKKLISRNISRKDAVTQLQSEFGRGYFSIIKVINTIDNERLNSQ